MMWVSGSVFARILGISALMAAFAAGQDMTAVVVFADQGSKPAGSVDACTAERELRFAVIQKAKINGKENLMAAGGAPTARSEIQSREYGKFQKTRLRDIRKLAWRRGVLYGAASFDTGIPATPVLPEGMQFQKNAGRPLSSLYDVTIEGEVPRTKQRVNYPLKSIAGIYWQPANTPVDEGLFAHAREQADYGTWMALLNRPGSFKVKEAEREVVRSLQGCVDGALAEFEKGQFGIIETAMKLANVVKGMAPGSAEANDYIDKLTSAKSRVEGQIAEGSKLASSKQWDAALLAWTPVKKYVIERNKTQLAAYIGAYRDSVQNSHDEHTAMGDTLLHDKKLKEAISHYDIALGRIPDSPSAAKGKREARTVIALDEAADLRKREEPRQAMTMLQTLLGEAGFGEDPRLQSILKDCKCDLADQLYKTARPKVEMQVRRSAPDKVVVQKKGGTPRAAVNQTPVEQSGKMLALSTRGERDTYLEARGELQEAVSLCSKDQLTSLLGSVNQNLGLFHREEARKALGQVPKRSATALAHLNTAQSYDPQLDLGSMMGEANRHLEEKSEILVGVTFDDASPNRNCGGYAQELTQFAERALAESAGGSRLRVVDGNQLLRGGANSVRDRQWMAISGRVTNCGAFRNQGHGETRQIRSEYWADEQKTVKQPYAYSETVFSLSSILEVTFQPVSSAGGREAGVLQGARGQGAYNCKTVRGVVDRDAHNWFTRPHNNECNDVPDAGAMMIRPMQETQAQLAAAMRTLGPQAARVFYDLAERTPDDDMKREHALTFLLSGGGASFASHMVSARSIATAKDKDLKFQLR